MMNEWPPYVGVVTGIVGMITGVTGACLGYLGYRRSGRVKELPATGDDYRTLSPEELESRLVAIDVLQAKASRIRDKCHGTIVADEKWRESLQATQYR